MYDLYYDILVIWRVRDLYSVLIPIIMNNAW